MNIFKMITCRLCGGLGNQLFQIFTTIAYALKHSKSFFFLNNRQLTFGSTIRYTYWDTLFASLRPYLKMLNDIPQLSHHNEISFSYNEIPGYTDGVVLIGYYQSYKYFHHFKNQIFDIIRINDLKNNLLNKMKLNYNKYNVVSMHFRLGDYKKYPNIYHILNNNYYINAINYISTICFNDKQMVILYFCEDESISEVKSIIKLLKKEYPNISFHKASSQLQDWEQMLLMSLCNHNIIANSTFSWWGAYLGETNKSKVYTPDWWFGDNRDYTELNLPNWKIVKTN